MDGFSAFTLSFLGFCFMLSLFMTYVLKAL